ncbi:MAG: hypothetical protein ACRDHP_19085 [Ktedonobacterales bacterium]
MSEQFDPAENNLPECPPAEASGSTEMEETLNDEVTRDAERVRFRTGDESKPRSTPRAKRQRSSHTSHEETLKNPADGILQLPVRGETQSAHQSDESDETLVVAELEAQGFTADEAVRLVSVSGRVATSREAREAEATLRRLRFTRWLIERGVLDEFSA